MELYINDNFSGECKSYHQKDRLAWSFLMENEEEIEIPFNKIKQFNSCGKLEIILFD